MTQVATFIIFLLLSGTNCKDEQINAFYRESLESSLAEFTQSIYVDLATNSNTENFVFSPLSLHSALCLLYLAAKQNSTTQNELGAAMGKINSQDLIKSAYKNIINSYGNQNSFSYGNHIWVSNQFDVDPSYKEMVSTNFGSDISNLNFEKRDAVDEVNNWIKNITNDKIENFIERFSTGTEMLLANAFSFKEKWLIPFEEKTVEGNLIEVDFKIDSRKMRVPMVWQESDKFVYGEIKTPYRVLEVVTIPYENKNFEMQIIIPKNNKHLSILETILRLEKKRDKFDKSSFNLFKMPKNESTKKYDEIRLTFPTFKVRSKFNAAQALRSLGANTVFSLGAELEKIKAAGPIQAGNIYHEAIVEVTNAGTDSAGGNAIDVRTADVEPKKKINILLDRPFIFIIQDTVNNIPVMVGRIKNPNLKL
eukprot:GFUD01024076.1.p1 GENE.GFUD01024076.1~~GFUD01024076.1.p1  ORF type:complete len:422 (+),score=72.95 GFUD01024076.1:3-1268(+)